MMAPCAFRLHQSLFLSGWKGAEKNSGMEENSFGDHLCNVCMPRVLQSVRSIIVSKTDKVCGLVEMVL